MSFFNISYLLFSVVGFSSDNHSVNIVTVQGVWPCNLASLATLHALHLVDTLGSLRCFSSFLALLALHLASLAKNLASLAPCKHFWCFFWGGENLAWSFFHHYIGSKLFLSFFKVSVMHEENLGQYNWHKISKFDFLGNFGENSQN